MPSNQTLNPISAFTIYKKSQTSTKIKKKKRKTKNSTLTVPISKKLPPPAKKIVGKSNEIVKPQLKYIPNDNDDDEDTVPELVAIDQPAQTISDEIYNVNEVSSPSSTSDDPVTEALNLFKWLIFPILPQKFLHKYWEQRPVHIKRKQPTYYSHILNSTQLDKIIRNNPIYYDKNIDVVAYENNKKEVFNQVGRVTASALWDYYANGCSIRLLNPQTYSHKVHLLLTTLQEYFGTMVGANVYLTPPGSQGFAPHFDDIEAFVVQLEGRKHWKLYEPKGSDVLARFSSHNLNHKDIGEPFMSLTLEAGEILYFPRGVIHEGRTDPDSHSLHITISVYQRTAYADLLEHVLPDALEKAAQNDIEFRRGLPLNYLKKIKNVPRDKNSMTKTVKRLIESLVEYIDVDQAADLLGKKFMRDSMPPVFSKSENLRSVKADGPCLAGGKVVNKVEFSPDTKVRLLRYYCLRIVNGTEVAKLYYNTENALVYHGEEEQWLDLDTSMVPIISTLQSCYPNYVTIEELPLEDEAVKMQLISDLWERGLLVTEHPLECCDSDLEDDEM